MTGIRKLIERLETGFAGGEIDFSAFYELKERIMGAVERLEGHQEEGRQSGPAAHSAAAAFLSVLATDGGELGNFAIRSFLGRGESGYVYHVHDMERGDEIALKVMVGDTAQVENISRALAERHERYAPCEGDPHIVRDAFPERGFFGDDLPFVLLKMPLAVKNLRSWLRERPQEQSPYFSEWSRMSLEFFAQALAGVRTLHANGLSHLNIKPDNILIFEEDGYLVAKIADYAPTVSPVVLVRKGQASRNLPYLPPEAFRTRPKDLGPEFDVYAMGCLLFEILDGEPLFTGEMANDCSSDNRELAAATRTWDEATLSFSPVLEACLTVPEKRLADAAQFESVFTPVASAFLDILSNTSRFETEKATTAIENDGEKADAAPAPVALKGSFVIGSIDMSFTEIQAGKFTMGDMDFGPRHSVTLTRSFWLGIHQVTQIQYEALMGVNPSRFQNDKSPAPVEQVTWEDAVAFCRKLTEMEAKTGRVPKGYIYRLPTEAEWEYCCRAGATTAFCFGASDTNLGAYAWYNGNNPQMPRAVGRKTANAWGLFDMHGNVWEWCHDCYGPYSSEAVTDPTGPATGEERVYRGGSWRLNANYCRSACRRHALPVAAYDSVGFRVALAPALPA